MNEFNGGQWMWFVLVIVATLGVAVGIVALGRAEWQAWRGYCDVTNDAMDEADAYFGAKEAADMVRAIRERRRK